MADSNRSANADNNRRQKNEKPKKPRPDFPLYPHASGRWAKKVRGKLYYFGSWADGHQAALGKWLEQKDDLLAGRKPRKAATVGVSAQDACDFYLAAVDEKVDRGVLSRRWFEDLKQTLTVFVEVVGRHWDVETLTVEDFSKVADRFWIALPPKKNGKRPPIKKGKEKRVSPITVKNRIHRVKGMFNWLKSAGLIAVVPAFGPAFDPPDKKVIDRHKNAKETRYFNRLEIRALLRHSKEAHPQLFVAILLAINVSCQNVDIETMQVRDLDLKDGWYTQPRSKNGKKRRAKLWTRTVKAIRNMLKERKSMSETDLVFVSISGQPWSGRNCLGKEFAVLKKAAGITTPKAGFQWLRHSFITEASQTGDIIAVQLACGHASKTITENYIHNVYDPRLESIAATVENWLIGDKKKR